jgi:hypothetical protein
MHSTTSSRVPPGVWSLRRLAKRVRRVVLSAVVIVAVPSAVGAQFASTSPATQRSSVTPGEPHTITIVIPTSGRVAGNVRYTIEPSTDVTVNGARTGTLSWDPKKNRELGLKLQLAVPKQQAPGSLVAARVVLRWPDGEQQVVDITVDVAPLPPGRSTKDIEAEVIPVPRVAGPGSLVKLLYTIFSYEDTDERVTLRVVGGPGWVLADPEVEQRELVLEAWEEIEGELFLKIPEDAKIGDRQLVRLLVEVVGEAGEVEAQTLVSVAKRGGARPGVPTLTATAGVAATHAQSSRFDSASTAGQFELSGKLDTQTTVSFAYRRRVLDNMSNFRFEHEVTRITGSLRRGTWLLSFGNQVSAQGNAVTGPYVRGRGASIRRTNSLFVGDLVVSQPSTYLGEAAGHLVRGGAGVNGTFGRFGLIFSDFERPAGGYSTINPIVYTTLNDPDEQERLDNERRLAEQAPSNRVQGAGLEGELRLGRAQRFHIRGGQIRMQNAKGQSLDDWSGEASYTVTTSRGNFSARFREMPAELSGIYIPGDERAANGQLRVWKALRVLGHASRSRSETLDGQFVSTFEGFSAGLSVQQQARRVLVRANYRESQTTDPIVRRTVSLSGGLPVKAVSINANAEVGEQERKGQSSPLSYYRGDLRWTGMSGMLSLGVSEQRRDRRAPVRRADLLGSFAIREFEFAGGGWVTQGYVSGGRPGGWGSLGIPIGGDLVVTMGVDYAPIIWSGQPLWRGRLGIRRKFMLSLPFLATGVPPGSSETSPSR